MSIKIIKPGLQTSIQDLGRHGYMHQGISNSGAMDPLSLQLANWLVSKPVNSAAFEITLIGPTIEFTQDYAIAICGAEFELFLNGNMVFNNEVIEVKAGDRLEFDKRLLGARAYLAIAGDLAIEPLFASRATHLTAGFGGFNGRALKAGDEISVAQTKHVENRQLPLAYKLKYASHYLLRCCPSVETEQFSNSETDAFYKSRFEVSQDSNRMGIRLTGAPVSSRSIEEMTSGGLVQGSIQIPPSGQPIISSVDGQTIGGYPRIANVITADLSLLGQLKPNDQVRFIPMETEAAEKINLEQKILLENLST